MSNHKNIYFLGYSGHAYVAIEVARANELNILGYFDNLKSENNPFDLNYCGSENQAGFKTFVKDAFVFPAMGSNMIRKKIQEKLTSDNIKQIVLIDPSAYISNTSSIGKSTLVNPNVSINSLAKIGKCCIINTAAVIEHECNIGDFTHVGPGAVLAGNVTIGANCFVGANAVVKQGIRIGDNVVVGAGAVVIRDIPNNEVWAGNPASRIRTK